MTTELISVTEQPYPATSQCWFQFSLLAVALVHRELLLFILFNDAASASRII
jgi:hypothetical protein